MKQKLINIIADVINVDPSEVEDSTGPANCESWDSLAQVVILSRISDELGIDVPFDSMMDIRSVGDFFQFLEGE